MASQPIERLLRWVHQCLFGSRMTLTPEMQRAKSLIAAIDAGGVPLNPARINAIARNMGLAVSRKAPAEDTIQRIRRALERS